MTGTGQLLVLEIAAGVFGGSLGYLIGRILRRRERYQAEQDGYDACLDDYEDVLRPGRLEVRRLDEPAVSSGVSAISPGPGHPDWREQVAAELAPEALKRWEDSLTGPQAVERAPGHKGPSAGQGAVSTDAAALAGAPSPYPGPLTPGQRRRDKHKQRGQYAPAPGWTADPDHVLASHWKPEGDRWMAEWRIEWQDDVAAVDEEIAAWTERQRLWLAADRWDRGARRLGAVA